MAFTVVFWNVQRWTANSPQNRTQAAGDIIKQLNADIVFLEESNESLADIMKGLGYELLGFVNTQAWDGSKTQLQITGWKNKTSPLKTTEGRALRLRTDGVAQKRARLKVNVSADGGKTWIALYAVHANASKGGGIAAVQEAVFECRKGTRTVCAGDFNYDLNFDGKNLNIIRKPHVQVVQPVDPFGKPVKTHKKGGILDFAILSDDLAAVALPNKYTKWSTIDHRPLVVQIG